jgi:hypothetical protein
VAVRHLLADTNMDDNFKPGESYLVNYAVDHFGAEVYKVERVEPERPPFPCLTGATNTNNSFRIDHDKYLNIVAAGIDTLELNYGIIEYRKPEIFGQLDKVRSEAKSSGYKGRLGKPVELFGEEFMVQAHGSRGGYEYVLKNGDIELQMMSEAKGGKTSPELRAICRFSG